MDKIYERITKLLCLSQVVNIPLVSSLSDDDFELYLDLVKEAKQSKVITLKLYQNDSCKEFTFKIGKK